MTQSCKSGSVGRLAGLLEPRLFRALSEPNRVAILADLACRGDGATVGEVASRCVVNLSVVSRHLATLRSAGVLEAQRSGREVRYRVRAGALAAAFRALAEALEVCCPGVRTRKAPGGRQRG